MASGWPIAKRAAPASRMPESWPHPVISDGRLYLLERDFNLPPIEELMAEVGRIEAIQEKWSRHAGSQQKRQA